ncbi:MAG: hemolysin family protein [Brumimicrobium sp.]|nr:hemolysin family protein [Brumimicrobium sp.]
MILSIILISLLASAYFSGVEIAYISANRLKIELDKQKGILSGKILARFVKDDSRFIAALLLGNNIALVVYSIWMALLLESWISPLVGGNDALVMLTQTFISTLIILILSEFLPKALFQINPNFMLRLLVLPTALIYYLLYPLTLFTVLLSNALLRIFGIKMKSDVTEFSRVDLDYYVRDLNERMEERGGELDNEMQILQNALDFSELRARDCMIPRTDIVSLDIECTIEELQQKFIESGLSKILIYRNSIDNIIGYVHSFELFKKPERVKEILIPIAFVPEALLAKNLLEIFAKQHGNIAVVVDEYGGTSGLVTIEDVVEEIFGDIEDEHDKDELIEQRIDERTFLFSARQYIDYLNETYDFGLEESNEYETLGGLILYHLEDIPTEGDILKLGKYTIEIKSVSERRIELIQMKLDED